MTDNCNSYFSLNVRDFNIKHEAMKALYYCEFWLFFDILVGKFLLYLEKKEKEKGISFLWLGYK